MESTPLHVIYRIRVLKREKSALIEKYVHANEQTKRKISQELGDIQREISRQLSLIEYWAYED